MPKFSVLRAERAAKEDLTAMLMDYSIHAAVLLAEAMRLLEARTAEPEVGALFALVGRTLAVHPAEPHVRSFKAFREERDAQTPNPHKEPTDA